jgi:hypothetical protein
MSFDLATWQRATTELIAGAMYDGDDPALRELAGSERLEIVRDIVRAWRELRIRTSCPLTTELLDERGIFTETVAAASRNGASPYPEAFATAFLAYVTQHFDDEDLVETAEFEREMIRVYHV